jgi:LytS/YehU family sensor histidine kinase
MFIYFAILGFGEALRHYRAARAREVRESRLEARLAQAQLHALRGQLHPHFLFNTLHIISALMTREPHTARRMITRLSDLLRLSLEDDGRHEVTLEEELEFLDRYVDIQKQRFGERLEISYDVEPRARRVLVPRLLLQPLVENSIVHGLSRQEGIGRVNVLGRIADGVLRLAVLDNGPGIGATVTEGIGLGNTRERLRQHYGDGAHFEIENRAEGGLVVRIMLPGRVENEPDEGDADTAPLTQNGPDKDEQ